jgi:hypothetical protein
VESAFPDNVSKLVRRALAVVARREFPTESMGLLPPFPKAVAEEVEVEVASPWTKKRAMTRARAKAAPPREDAALRQRQRRRTKKALARLKPRVKVQESGRRPRGWSRRPRCHRGGGRATSWPGARGSLR